MDMGRLSSGLPTCVSCTVPTANRPHSGHSHAFGSGYPATAVAGAAAAAATGLPKESFLTLFSKQGKVHREKPVGERRYTVVL